MSDKDQAKIKRMREALIIARKQLANLAGTYGIHLSEADALATGCDVIQRIVILAIDEALK